MLNLARLAMLRELQRTGTMTAAAESLHYTHSAISQQLAQLERETGYTLFEKVGRRVELTEQGAILADYAVQMLALSEEAEAALAGSHRQVRGVLRVASFQTMVATVVPQALNMLQERHPDLTVEITQDEGARATEKLFSKQFDVVLDEDYPGVSLPLRPGVHRENIFEDPMRLVTPATGPWSEVESLEELSDAAWVLDPADGAPGIWARAMCRQAGFEPKVQFESVDALLFKHLVREGHAVAFLPDLLLVDEVGTAGGGHAGGSQSAGEDARGATMRVLSLPNNPIRSLYTTVLEGRQHHPAIKAFRAAIFEAAHGAAQEVSHSAAPEADAGLGRVSGAQAKR